MIGKLLWAVLGSAFIFAGVATAQDRKPPEVRRIVTGLDYAIIRSGEIDMMLDDKVVHLKAGDVVVQQATNHAWINHGKEVCRIAFILMDGKEP